MTESNLIQADIKGIQMRFRTSNEVFSPRGIDKGTLAMLSVIEMREGDKVLDLGCGYGIVGIFASKLIGSENVIMLDISEEAVKLSNENALLNGISGLRVYKSDGFKNFDEKEFTIILSNPPYHTDFSVAKEFIEKGFNRLRIGGRMVMVTKRKEWYRNKLVSIFGGCKVYEVDGYYVFVSEKRNESYANANK